MYLKQVGDSNKDLILIFSFLILQKQRQENTKHYRDRSWQKVWITEIYHQRVREGAYNMSFQELNFTHRALHFKYHSKSLLAQN